jgi:hypothetical protein
MEKAKWGADVPNSPVILLQTGPAEPFTVCRVPTGKVGWNTGAHAEMIQAARSAFGAVVVGPEPGHIQPAIVTVTRARC